jgi:hypothetical protein
MTAIEIKAADSSLPPLGLPAGALSASHPDYDHEIETDPPEIEPIEHRLRAAFVREGPLTIHELHGPGQPAIRQAATDILTTTAQTEQQYYLDLPTQETLTQAPAFLQAELREVRDHSADIQQRRQRWYTELIPTNLETIFGTVENCFPATPGSHPFEGTEYVGHVLVSADTDPEAFATAHDLSPEYVTHEAALDDHSSSSEYGIELPAPLLVGTYTTHSQYTLVPWTDGLVCLCPYKQTNPWAVMCKHELLATVRLAQRETWLLPIDDGLAVPQRARRFVSPRMIHR